MSASLLCRRARPLLLAAILFAAATSPAWSVNYYLSVDVPATLGSADYTPDQILRSDSAAYSVALALGGNVQFSALHRRPDGVWLAVLADPFFLGGTAVKPHDIVSTDGLTTALFFDGGAAGIPDDARIDSLFLESGGDLVLSFDVPVRLGGVEYGRSDLVRYSAGVFVLYWDAAAAGVPADANVVGADRDSAHSLVVSFDVPISLGGTDYLPGQLVRWNGGTSFSGYFADGAWPAYAQLRGFSFVPAAGSVPDGVGSPGVPLTISLSVGNLVLNWGSSCASGDTDYEVYEGTLGQPFAYNHTEKLCTTGGATTATFAAPMGSTYYLVVPKNAVSEGSYGQASSGAEIPPGSTACAPQQIALTCP
jgi:hypothetical protein